MRKLNWFYTQRWAMARKPIWTVIDNNYNLQIDEGVFVTMRKADEVRTDLESIKLKQGYKDHVFYRIIHRDSQDYQNFLTKKKERNVHENNLIE